MADVICPPITNSHGRSSDDPCSVYCGPDDFDKWKAEAQLRIRQAMSRQDLDASTRAKLVEWDRMVETMPRGKWENGQEVKMMASIAKQSTCVALALPDKKPDLIPVEPPLIPDRLKKYAWGGLVVVLGLLAAYAYFRGPTKLIGLVRGGKRK